MKKQLLSRKRLKTLFYSVFMIVLYVNVGWGQTASTGDYRSALSGNWSDINSWQVRDGVGNWTTSGAVPTATSNVYIQNGHTITVDVANGYCNDIQLNTLGVLAIGTNILNVNGKIRAYTTTLGAITGFGDGTFYSDQTSSTATAATMITTTNPGVLKFVGNTRTIAIAAEWNSSGTSNAAEFALNAGQIGSLTGTGVKFKPLTFSSGIISTDSFISASTGDLTIKNGATLITSRSSTAGVIGNSSAAPCGIVTIESGGILELTGSLPTINCTTFVNNGTVKYTKAGSQTLLSVGVSTIPGTAALNDYSTLVLGNSGSKTLFAAITVSTLMKFEGSTTAIATIVAPKSITMLNGSTIEKSTTTNPNTIISTASSALIYYGTDPSHLVNLTVSASNTSSGELNAAPPGPGKLGTLTVNSGVTYAISGGRNVTNIVNNGIIALAPTTSMTLGISGTLSGSGTFSSILSTGNTPNYFSGSLDFTNTGSIGTLYMTPGAKEIKNLGINGNLALGNAIQLNGNLTLTAGTLTNSGSLTLLNAASPFVPNTINRSGGSLDAAPVFGSAVNVNYSSSTAKTSTFEIPTSSTLLNNLTNSSGFATLTGAAKVNGVLTLTSGTVVIGANNLTLVSTPVITTGTIDASNAAATVTFANSSAITLPALPLFTGNVQNLTINGAGGVTLGSAISLAGKLTLTSGTLATGGLLTLKSGDCCTSATVAQVTGGSVTGNVIVERNIPAGYRAYRLLSSPVTTTGSIQANWQEGGTGDSFPGFGTHITGTGAGFDATTSNASSLFTHNNTIPAWIAALNTNTTTLTAGSPYLIYIRGSRLGTNITSTTNDVTTLRGTGTLTTGTVAVSGLNATANGFSLVGNPYQAQVDMGAVLGAATNLNTGFYYILEPKMGTKGTYVTVNAATGSNNSVGGSTANQYLQPWQACFVKTLVDGPASLSFQETNKFEGTQTSVFRKANMSSSKLSLAFYDTAKLAQNGYPLDGLVVDFDASESNTVNENDADKLTNFDENIATANSGKLLSMESRTIPTDSDEIPLSITKYRGTSYTIKAEGSGLTGSTPYLLDQFASKTTEIPQNGSVDYAYSVDAAIPASIASDRFKIIYAKTLKTIDNAVASFALYPNPSKMNSFSVVVPQSMSKASLTVYNLLGQKMYSQNDLQSGTTVKVTASNVRTSGVYLVNLTSEGKTTTTKWIVE
jgi:hypothetical protein